MCAIFHRRKALQAAVLAACSLAAPTAFAQAWPDKPIQLVIPYPPGGSADLLARPLALQLQQQLGQPVVLEYKPGAGGSVASQYVARAKPDGTGSPRHQRQPLSQAPLPHTPRLHTRLASGQSAHDRGG